MQISADEIMVCCMARQVHEGEIVAQGIATPMVAAAYLLARRTHAPSLYFVSAISQGICASPAPLGLLQVEKLWLDRALMTVGFVRAAADMLPRIRPREFFRPGQVEPHGNFNNIAFGKDYLTSGRHHPRLRLPGTGGIPDVTTYINNISLYVPRHSRVTFVPQLDVVSGLGHNPARRHGQGPIYLVTDLGQFDFKNGSMRLVTYHPGISIEFIQAKTGFPLEVAENVCETPLPLPEELELLRNEIDPLGIRRLELLSGAPRRELLQGIIAQEV